MCVVFLLKHIHSLTHFDWLTGGGSGDVILSETNDRIPDYRIFDLSPDGVFQVAATTESTQQGNEIDRVRHRCTVRIIT